MATQVSKWRVIFFSVLASMKRFAQPGSDRRAENTRAAAHFSLDISGEAVPVIGVELGVEQPEDLVLICGSKRCERHRQGSAGDFHVVIRERGYHRLELDAAARVPRRARAQARLHAPGIAVGEALRMPAGAPNRVRIGDAAGGLPPGRAV